MSESWYTFTEEDLAQVRTNTPIQRIEYFPELKSTNDRALELANNAPQPCPLLVLAQHQTEGRGRATNRWWSLPGTLTFSVLFDVRDYRLSPRDFPQISLATALALQAGMRDTQPACHPKLKWPNDIFLSGRKVAGLLLEPVASNSGLLVVGAGINVNSCMEDAPPLLRDQATSIFDTTQSRSNLSTLLVNSINRMITHYHQLANKQLSISRRWQPDCLLEGHTVTLQIGQQQVRGLCRGVNEQGALLIENESGLQEFHAGSVLVSE